MAEQGELSFAGLLRQLRAEANLTQEELAEAARLSAQSVSDLERGINRTARKDTALLLADALRLAGPVRTSFVAAARGRGPAADVLAARSGTVPGAFAASATQALPRDVVSFTGRQAELARLMGAMDARAAPIPVGVRRWPRALAASVAGLGPASCPPVLACMCPPWCTSAG